MKIKILTPLLILFILAACSSPTDSPLPNCKNVGTVTNGNTGVGIEGAKLHINYTDIEPVFTDLQGRYTFIFPFIEYEEWSRPGGVFYLNVSKAGYTGLDAEGNLSFWGAPPKKFVLTTDTQTIDFKLYPREPPLIRISNNFY